MVCTYRQAICMTWRKLHVFANTTHTSRLDDSGPPGLMRYGNEPSRLPVCRQTLGFCLARVAQA